MANQRGALLPFLKWAGGKRWLAESLSPYFRGLRGTYYEPFLGSGAVYFHHQPASAVLADANTDLIECYSTLREWPALVEKTLMRLAELDPHRSYYNVRAARPRTRVGRAARFIYLNRTCWNGLYRVNLRGEFNVPRGTKTQIIFSHEDFSVLSSALTSAELRQSDFEHTIQGAGPGDLVFADPPYTVAHNMNGFVKYNQKIFGWDDQLRLAKSLSDAASRGATVVSTNADHPDVIALYKDDFMTNSVERKSVIAAASQYRRRTTELFITNAMVDA